MAQEKLKNYESEIEQLKRDVENCKQQVFTKWSNWSVCSCEGSSLNYLFEMYDFSVEKYPGENNSDSKVHCENSVRVWLLVNCF